MRLLSIKELKLVKFPEPVRLGNRIAFVEQEVDRWIETRVDDRDRWSADMRDDVDPTQLLDS